jgi:hypothetical protein
MSDHNKKKLFFITVTLLVVCCFLVTAAALAQTTTSGKTMKGLEQGKIQGVCPPAQSAVKSPCCPASDGPAGPEPKLCQPQADCPETKAVTEKKQK